MRNLDLRSPYDGHTCKTVSEYLAEGQKARDRDATEQLNSRAPKPEAEPKRDFRQTMRDLETQKQAAIRAEIDEQNGREADRMKREAEAKANPSKFIADTLGESGLLSDRSVKQLRKKAKATDKQLAVEQQRAEQMAAFRASDDYQSAVKLADTAMNQPTPELTDRAVGNREYLAKCTTPEMVQQFIRDNATLMKDKCSHLDTVAQQCMEARNANVTKFSEAAAAARESFDQLAAAESQLPEGGAE